MSFWFSKEDIIYLHSTIVMKTGGEDGEAIRSFYVLPQEKSAMIPLKIGFVQRLTKGL